MNTWEKRNLDGTFLEDWDNVLLILELPVLPRKPVNK